MACWRTTSFSAFSVLVRPQIQLRLRHLQPIQRERHRAHGEAAAVDPREAAARGVPELGVERGGVERHGAGDGGVVVVRGLDPEPPRDQATAAEPAAQPLAQHPQQRMQHAEVVGVGGEGMGDVELGRRSGGSTGRGSMPRARARSARPVPPKTAQSALSAMAATSPMSSSW